MSVVRPRVVIIGGGFGGLYAARALAHEAVDVTVIDRTNHHVFQPLLYQVATATLAPTDITAPIRWLLRDQDNASVLMADVTAIDVERTQVACDDGALSLNYDYLIVAAGSRHSYFGHDEWEKTAPGLKTMDDAIVVRQRFLLAFERAEKATTEEERQRWLTFVIVGGGPTGVELAGMLPLIAGRTLLPEFKNIDTRKSRVLLFEGGPRLLPTFHAKLGERARADLTEFGVEVRTSAIVTKLERGAVWVGQEKFEAETVFWAAGNEASSLGKFLGAPQDKVGHVKVEADLSVPGRPEIFVIGDQAEMYSEGKRVPGVAQGAIQSGLWAAKNIVRRIQGRSTTPFRYWNKGDAATIGRYRALFQFESFNLTGRTAWWFWLLLHIMYLAGFRNRVGVLLEWAVSYFTYQRGARLITTSRR